MSPLQNHPIPWQTFPTRSSLNTAQLWMRAWDPSCRCVCTIYNGCFPDKSYQRIASLALAIFNDVIIRVAIERGLSVIDLRLICTAPTDYANPIEPSSIGGEKIAKVIVALVTGRYDQVHGTRILSAPGIRFNS